MSSMQRSIRRGMERKQGIFVAQKPLRPKNHVSVKDMLLKALRGMAMQKKAAKANKKEEI